MKTNKKRQFDKILVLVLGLIMAAVLLVIVLLALGRPKGDYDDFLEALGNRESSGDYGAKNRYGYLGKYQLGEKALQDAGFLDEDGDWTELAGSYGIRSESDFLASPEGQEAAVRAYHRRLCRYMDSYKMEAYLGKRYCGVTVTESGLLAACHLVGARSMRDALLEDATVSDANGVSAAAYMERFAGYDISSLEP